jgi:hypothetical protein
MLGYVADRDSRLIVEGKRNRAFRHTFHAMTLTRVGGRTALVGGRSGDAHVATNPTTPSRR